MTATLQILSTPIPEDISKAVGAVSTSENTVSITNHSINRTLKVFRRFTNQQDLIVELDPQETFIDEVAWDGSDYYYFGEDAWGNRTTEVMATTPSKESTEPRDLHLEWEPAAKSLGWDTEIKPGSRVYPYLEHGVTVRVVYEEGCINKLTEKQMFEYAMVVAHLFDYNWQLYEAFPLDE